MDGVLERDTHVTPWRIEDEFGRLAGSIIQAGLCKGVAIRDGNLVTGQQNFSAEEVATVILETVGH